MIVSFNLMSAMDCPLSDLKEIILSDDETRLQAALDKGVPIDIQESDGNTPLCRAAEEGLIKMIKILLDRNAQVNLADRTGNTPLHCAAFMGRADVVRMLLDHHADINARTKGDQKYGETPLHLACEWNHGEVVRALLEKSPDLEANYSGVTPLYKAVQNGYLKIVTLLADAGANVQVQDRYKKSALRVAMGSKHVRIVEELLKRGARSDCPIVSSGISIIFRYKFFLNEVISGNVNCLQMAINPETDFLQLVEALHYAIGQRRVGAVEVVTKELVKREGIAHVHHFLEVVKAFLTRSWFTQEELGDYQTIRQFLESQVHAIPDQLHPGHTRRLPTTVRVRFAGTDDSS